MTKKKELESPAEAEKKSPAEAEKDIELTEEEAAKADPYGAAMRQIATALLAGLKDGGAMGAGEYRRLELLRDKLIELDADAWNY